MSPKFTGCIPNLLFKSDIVAEEDLDFWDFDFAMMMSFCKILIDYIIKKAFLLGKRLVIVSDDGIFASALVKLQHCQSR